MVVRLSDLRTGRAFLPEIIHLNSYLFTCKLNGPEANFRWRALVNSVLNLRVPWNAGKLSSGLTSSRLSSSNNLWGFRQSQQYFFLNVLLLFHTHYGPSTFQFLAAIYATTDPLFLSSYQLYIYSFLYWRLFRYCIYMCVCVCVCVCGGYDSLLFCCIFSILSY
jgi:hypothetical protein